MQLTMTPAEIQAKADSSGFRVVGHHDLGGHGDGFQVIKRDEWVYVAHLGESPMALSILDGSNPASLRLVHQIEHPPNTRCHKVQIAGDVLIQNNERPYWLRDRILDQQPIAGLTIYEISNPTEPRPVGFHPSHGDGTHRLWFDSLPYAHISSFGGDDRYRRYEIVDLSEPSNPRTVGEWWIPGSRESDAAPWEKLRADERFGVHGVIPHGDRAYVACLDAGFAILDISTPSAPRFISRVDWSPPYGGFVHTTLPLPSRGLVVASDEGLIESVHGGDKRIWMVDVREERQPVTIATFPVPRPPAATGAQSYRELPGRYGPHNLHENRTGSFISDHTIFATFFNAGLRAYDISNPHRPEQIAHFVPPTPAGQEGPMLNDLFVDAEGLVYVTDRGRGGLYTLEFTG